MGEIDSVFKVAGGELLRVAGLPVREEQWARGETYRV